MKKKMKTLQVGKIHINTKDLDVTDPGYDDDVWCRLHIKDMQPGTYNCVVQYLEEGANAKRYFRAPITIAKASIYLADGNEAESVKQRVEAGRSWRMVGMVGVDSGQAGFFAGHKPNFSDREWEELCNWMYDRKDVPQGDKPRDWYIRMFDEPCGESFWTASGYGDGAYSVHAIHSLIGKKRVCTAVEIRFIG